MRFYLCKSRLILAVTLVLALRSLAQAQEDAPSFASSLYVAGGYGLPATIRAEGGYVFGQYASVALLVTGPVSVDDALAFSIGASCRAFLPFRTAMMSPFLVVSYSDSSPFAFLNSDVRRDELGVEVGALWTVAPGVHLRGQIGASTVNAGAWKPSWSLQFEFSLLNLSKD